MAIPETDVWMATLQKFEAEINKSEGDGLRARWESGRRLLSLKKGRQLPKKVLDVLVVHLKRFRAVAPATPGGAVQAPRSVTVDPTSVASMRARAEASSASPAGPSSPAPGSKVRLSTTPLIGEQITALERSVRTTFNAASAWDTEALALASSA